MDQVNINAASPSSPPPPRPPARWPIYIFIAALVIVAVAVFAIRHTGSPQSASPTATPQPVVSVNQPTATSVQSGPTSTAASALAATATPVQTRAASTATALQLPTNPRMLQAASGSCTDHRITWSWTGAQRAASYEVVLYDPRTGATIKDTTTTGASFTLPAGPGAAVALKVRSRNSAGAARQYTSGSIGRVPPATTNPTAMTVASVAHTITWSWTGARHARAYDIVLYHYSGATARTDIRARIDQGRWGIKVTPGLAYYLKVRSVGPCVPSTYFTPAKAATAGATPTPGT